MSQRTLARRAKVPQPTLSRIESGKTNPNLATLEKIYKALFCDFVLLPLPWRDIDQIVQQQIRRIAEKRVQYLKGTMALELQQPQDEFIRELVLQEERELEASESFDIWSEEELHDDSRSFPFFVEK
jgi:transcriptional regulator with XRE-family HTH domain